jgi:hypothetical protein
LNLDHLDFPLLANKSDQQVNTRLDKNSHEPTRTYKNPQEPVFCVHVW